MRTTMTTTLMHAAVRGGQRSHELRSTAAAAARERLLALQQDSERGAQAAEYAMLGGVSAAACGGLIAILSNTDVLDKLVKAVVSALVKAVTQWF